MNIEKNIEYYKEQIKYYNNANKNLDVCELLTLLAECIGDREIIDEVNKYKTTMLLKNTKSELDKNFAEQITSLAKTYSNTLTGIEFIVSNKLLTK